MARNGIKAKVDQLLQATGMHSAPIDVELVARHLGAIVSYEPFEESLSGVCIKEAGRVVIGVNSSHSKSRQRFTIAHECGHLALGHKGELFIDRTVMRRDARSSLAVDTDEIEANQFAAELLMPAELLKQSMGLLESRYGQLPPSETVQKLGDEYRVSTQAMEYRLANMGMYMLR